MFLQEQGINVFSLHLFNVQRPLSLRTSGQVAYGSHMVFHLDSLQGQTGLTSVADLQHVSSDHSHTSATFICIDEK